MTKPRYMIRAAGPSDRDFIMDTWVKTLRGTEYYRKRDMPNEIFKEIADRIEGLANRVRAMMICHPDYPDQLFGYAIGEDLPGRGPCLYFSYVSKGWRKFGMANAAARHIFPSLGKAEVAYAFKTKPAHALAKKYNLHFDPLCFELGAALSVYADEAEEEQRQVVLA